MHNFVRNLITEWRRLELPFQDSTFVVAVSGGADSVALLLAIDELVRAEKLRNRFIAAHFNHKLRGEESEDDEQFVKTLCGNLKIELAIGHGQVPDAGNLEQNARDARYAFLKDTAENLGAHGVLAAHTQNDQAETFLMNLIRGSGPEGLGGMRVVREMVKGEEQKGKKREKASEPGAFESIPLSPLLPFSASSVLLLRPLLNWAHRHDTEAYCRDRQVEYRYDSMNENLDFTRVRIRKLLLPMLEEFNPKIVETLANTAFLMQSTAAETEKSAAASEDGLSIKELKILEKPDLYTLIREWLAKKRGTARGLSLKHIEAVERLALSRKSGRLVELPGGGTVVKTAGTLVYEDLVVEKRPSDN